MTFYNNTFDVSIQCDEVSPEVNPEEMAEVFQMMADEHQAFESSGLWSESLERDEPEEKKDWLNGYSNDDDGEFYNGIAI